MTCRLTSADFTTYVQYRFRGQEGYDTSTTREIAVPHSYFDWVYNSTLERIDRGLDEAMLGASIPDDVIAFRVFEVSPKRQQEEGRTNPFFNIVDYIRHLELEIIDNNEVWPVTGTKRLRSRVTSYGDFPRDLGGGISPMKWSAHLNDFNTTLPAPKPARKPKRVQERVPALV